MTYKEALAYLNDFICYERKTGWKYGPGAFNLSGFQSLLTLLGRPQRTYPTIHLAGSDGKGSTAAILASILREAGYHVGLYTSPHLEDIRERVTVDGEWIPPEAFAEQVSRIRDAVKTAGSLPKSYATFFELVTALAFLHFQSSDVDVAVIETGLGGRLDATNVLQPDLTAITHLSLEHTETLGNTLEKIASEKLAICQAGVPAVIAHQKPEVMPFVRDWLKKSGVPMHGVADCITLTQARCEGSWRVIDYRDRRGSPQRVRVPLLGYYQVDNTLTALTATGLLPRFSEPLGESAWWDAVRRGCERVVWPGRYEVLQTTQTTTNVRVVLDGAHTALGAKTLRETLDEVEGDAPRVLVLGFLQGKKVSAMLSTLIRPIDTIIVTKAPTPRGMPTQQILDAYSRLETEKSPKCLVIDEPLQALQAGVELAQQADRTLIVAGSLYLVGACRTCLAPTVPAQLKPTHST